MDVYQETKPVPEKRSVRLTINRAVLWLYRNWLWAFAVPMGLYVGVPFLAPVFYKIGWQGAGDLIYWFYSFQCHQLPQRSFFLFGSRPMLSLPEIQSLWQNTDNPIILRRFIGSPAVGWKVAWSDRMVYMYASTLILGLVWWPLRRRVKPLPWWGLILFLLPMALDGGTHFISDLAGLGQGFRYTNLWLANLTNYAFPTSFYSGNALGSFNSWMRLLSGIFFGIGVVWFGFPYVDEWFDELIAIQRAKFSRREAGRW
jgi:uncharacterized membrane protein